MNDIKDRTKNGIDTAADKAKSAVDTAANAAGEAREEGQGAVDRLKENAQHLMDKAGESAQHVQGKVRDWANDARGAVQNAGERGQEMAGEAYGAAAQGVSTFGNEVSALVRKHPVQALLIGFGVGLLIGRTTRSSS